MLFGGFTAGSTYVGECPGARAGKTLPGWGFYGGAESGGGKEEERRGGGVLLEAGGSDKTSTTEARRPGCF